MNKPDRQFTAHVYPDGRIAVVITCPALDLAISRHVYNLHLDSGWKYVLQLLARALREWEGLHSRILITFETSDECPQCSKIGAGPLCKAHR